MFEESRENTGGVIAGMLRSLEDGNAYCGKISMFKKQKESIK